MNGLDPRLPTVIGVIACVAVLAAGREAAPAAASETEITASAVSSETTTASASAFQDSVGVNAAPTWFDTPYGDWPRILATIRELGVNHIRASIVFSSNEGWNTRVFDALSAAARLGIRFNLLVDFRCSYDGTMDPCLRAMKTRMPLKSIESVEWPNEHDISGDPNWLASLTSWGHQLYSKMKGDPALRSIPVIGPSLVHPSSHTQVGDQTGFLDRGNLHAYMGATSPNPQETARFRRIAGLVSGNKPIVATEAGFHNALAQTNGDQPAADEASAAVYTVRTVLEYYVDGLERTYIFQLLDYRNDPYTSHANFGLLRNDWSPKPAFTALKNLLAMVGRSGPAAAAARLPYTIAGDTSDLRQLVLQKGDGSHLLILWRTASVWNRDTQQRLVVVPKRYALTLPTAVTAEVGDPIHSSAFMPVGIDGGGRTVQDIGADPLVLHVRSPGAGAPSTAVPAAGRPTAAGAPVPGAEPSAATVQPGADRRRPRVSRLRIRRSGRRYVASFRLSETARVTTRVDRARRGSRTRFRAVKRLTARQLRAGARTLSLGRLTRGRHRLVLTLRDAAGNRVGVARAFRVRSAARR